MTIFRIYTETKDNLIELVRKFFDNATLIPAKGLYDRNIEETTIIEIIEFDNHWYHNSRIKTINLAEKIKEINNQQCVLYTEQKIKSEMI